MKVVGSKPIFYAGYLTFASDIVKPNLRGQGTLLSETKGQVVRKTVDLSGVFHPFGGLMGAPEVTAEPSGTWMSPKDAVDGLSGKFWAATT